MAKSEPSPPPHAQPKSGAAAYLPMSAESRAAAETSAAMLLITAQKVADILPLGADVDDFRRVLVAEA